MKKVAIIFTLGLILIFSGLVVIRKDDIMTIFHTYFDKNTKEVIVVNKNDYYRDYSFMYVQNTNNFVPSNSQDLLNIYYTVINAGENEFTFYCPKEYESCILDVQSLANNQDNLSDISNFVHPFNGFSHIETEYDNLGKVTIKLTKAYSDDQIALINKKIDEVYPLLVNESDTAINNIMRVHDWIINNSRYDSLRSDQGLKTYHSDIAYGPLFEGYAVCGGYTDLMELFLERMKVKSFKVSSDTHIWNAVFLDGAWHHLDLTWDDPVADDGIDYLEHNFFLISTSKLNEIEQTQHTFNPNVFLEFKES